MPVGDLWRRRILGEAPQPVNVPVRLRPDPPASEGRAETGEEGPEMGTSTVISTGQNPAQARSHRLAAFAVLAWAVALLLAAVDEYSSLPHAAAINAALFLMAVLVIFSLLLTLRGVRAWRRAHTLVAGQFRDAITGLPNYRYLHLRLGEEALRAKRYRRPLALAVVDVNSLDSVNQQYGWACGDQVLRHVGKVLEGSRRGSDLVGRLADDHFALILPECDDQGARAFVERLEQHLSRSPARVEADGNPFDLWVGICAGVAVLADEDTSASDLVSRAEASIQAAKDERDKRRRLWLSA